MDFRDGSQRRYWTTKLGSFTVELLWHILHYLVTVWYHVKNVLQSFESYLISYGLLKKYKSLDVSKVRYLAIVVESEEARHISDVIELVRWVAATGVKHLCLHDMEGVLKESRDVIIAKCNARPWKGVETTAIPLEPGQLTLEFTSVADGKEGVVKAANLLFLKYQGDQDKPKFTESLLSEALQLVGCSGPEPDLLLVYGPTRCHLGFPAWRLRYTEIVHMGCLKLKKRGSLVKAMYKFTTVRQNYGK
ncbi:hypothetical protein RND81_14G253800 [Saponaria officinalis]|uniref:ditrans,polycis-polyprenyl diphosphate synthase [(2E,6E)-farnesyldiphosphate specific] n=1 Tax=Saponaria officinalis TaxID=3572 RepID=A0AAW1GWF7_SAPOF